MSVVPRTPDDVHNSWTMVVSKNGLARMNLPESRRQVVRFISREAFVKLVDYQVVVVVMWDTLEPSLRSFDVL